MRWLRVETYAVAVCADVGEDVARDVLGAPSSATDPQPESTDPRGALI